MNKTLLPAIITLLWASSGLAQDSNSTVPASVRAMIERSQAATQHQQTARIQMDVQFRDFLSTLEGGSQRRRSVEAALMEVMVERSELSARVVSGQARSSELNTVGSYAYLRSHVAPLLSPGELDELDAQSGGPTDAQLKREYAGELSRIAADLSEENSELVLDTLVKHLRESSSSGRMSVDDLVDQQGGAFRLAQQELQSQISGAQWTLVVDFFNQLRANLYMNRTMTETTQ